MSFYKQLPEQIDIKALKHVPLNVLPEHGTGISNVFKSLAPLIVKDKFGESAPVVRMKVAEHQNFISRKENGIPGYGGVKSAQLLDIISIHLNNNKKEIDELMMFAFGDVTSVRKEDLTVQQVAIIDWLLLINLYVFSVVDISVRIIQVLTPDATFNHDKSVKKLVDNIIFVNGIRGNIRETLLIDGFVQILMNASTTVASPMLLSSQLEAVLPSGVSPSVDGGHRLSLFTYTPGVIKVFNFDVLDGFLSAANDFLSTFPVYIKAAKRKDSNVDSLKKHLSKHVDTLTMTVRKIGARTIPKVG